MPIKRINGKEYYYREYWNGGQIIWRYVASGESARVIRDIDRAAAEKSRALVRRLAMDRDEVARRIRAERAAWEVQFRATEAAHASRARSFDRGLRLARLAFLAGMKASGFGTYNRSTWHRRQDSMGAEPVSQLDRTASEDALAAALAWVPSPCDGTAVDGRSVDAMAAELAGESPTPLARLLAMQFALNHAEHGDQRAQERRAEVAIATATAYGTDEAEARAERARVRAAGRADRAFARMGRAARSLALVQRHLGPAPASPEVREA